jgi:hypothetical protein
VDWLVTSIVLSVVLTVVLNVALRAFPGAGDRAARRLEQAARRDRGDRRAQVWFPWKAMLVASLGLTVVLNLLLWLT